MGKTAATHENGVRAHGGGSVGGPSPLGRLPSEVRRILIVGAGGFGREVLQWARNTWPDHYTKFAGFLSADPHALRDHALEGPILGDPAAFIPERGDAFLLAIGIPGARRRVAEDLEKRGAAFLTLVHPTAVVFPTAAIGLGSILCPYAIASDSVRLGRFTLMNYHSSLGHDAATGNFAVLSPYATLGGGAQIGDDAFLGLHASVGPGTKIGPRSKLSANSAALHDAPADTLIHGVPGRNSPLCVAE